MRCRFASPSLVAEQVLLQGFDQRCHQFYTQLQHAPQAELARFLAEVDPDFELLTLRQSESACCIEVRSDLRKRPRLERFKQAAPPGVEVCLERGAAPFAHVRDAAAQNGVELARARVRAGITRGHLIELAVHVPTQKGQLLESAELAVEAAVEAMLGECLADDWVRTIEVLPLVGQGPLKLVESAVEQASMFEFKELKRTLDNAVLGIYAELPETPHHLSPSQQDWVMLEAEPQPECIGTGQADLVLASTCLPEMLKCFLEGAPFSSLRFSRHAERFAYLKYTDTGRPTSRAQLRQALEDTLDRELRSHGLGAVVGNGVGQAHSYIDLALADVDAALPSLRRACQGAQLPPTSWLLFCDSVWQLEWVGVWEHTPPPLL